MVPTPDWRDKELTIGQVSERSGAAVTALRFYETEGLIASTRTAGNQRRYHRDTLRRVALIRAAQTAGIPLAEIRAGLDRLPDGRTPNARDWARLAAGWRADLDRRIRTLEQIRDQFGDCIGCGCLSLTRCKLVNPGDELSEAGPGAQRLVLDD